jgi:hypothetical protein
VSTSSTVTEADILAEIIAPDKPGLEPEAARAILRLLNHVFIAAEISQESRERLRRHGMCVE